MEYEKSNIYIGEVIKQVIAEKQVTKAELARRLGVKPQSVDYLLTRKSIDTDTLYSLSLALDYDFAVLYSIKKEHALATDEESPFKVGNAKISLEIELRPDEMLKLNLKQKIADLLEGKESDFTYLISSFHLLFYKQIEGRRELPRIYNSKKIFLLLFVSC